MADPTSDTQQLGETRAIPKPPPKRGSFVPPLWSLALMVLVVAAVVGGVIMLVYGIGGGRPAPANPQVVLMTAPPPTPSPANTPIRPASPLNNGGNDAALPNFALEGPTLPPVYLSPTPDIISIGRNVTVINVGDSGLNVRSNPGINSPLVFTADVNALLEVMAGPESAQEDSFTWWRVRDVFTGEEGWAVQLYMEVQPETTTP